MTRAWTPRGVVFDFDGVLADTEGLHLAAYQEVFAVHGWPLGADEYYRRYLGYDDRGLLEAYARDRHVVLSPAALEALLTAKTISFRRRVDAGDVLYAGARACVERLSARFPLAVATGSLRDEVLAILGGARLLPLFTAIVAADDVRATKPHPEPYATAAARLGVEPAACAAIEDSHWGLASARAAGMRTIGIGTTSPRASLALADLIVDRVDDITVELIESLATVRSG